MRDPILIKAKKSVAALVAAAALLLVGTSTAQAAISVETETRQTFYARGVKPNTNYATYFYAYRYPGDPYPYALGYSGLPSNPWGQYKSSVLLSDLAPRYEGQEGHVYSVRACLLEPPSYNEVACTGYSYVGYVPPSLWTYGG